MGVYVSWPVTQSLPSAISGSPRLKSDRRPILAMWWSRLSTRFITLRNYFLESVCDLYVGPFDAVVDTDLDVAYSVGVHGLIYSVEQWRGGKVFEQ